MGFIPAVALDAAATFAGDVLTTPLPAAIAAVLAVLAVVGLRLVGGASGPTDGPASWRHGRMPAPSPQSAPAVLLPRLPRRVTSTRTPRPADAPDVAASGLLRGPPGLNSRPIRFDVLGGPQPL